MFIFSLKHVTQMKVALMVILSNWISFTIVLFCYETFHSLYEQNFFHSFPLGEQVKHTQMQSRLVRRVQIKIYREKCLKLDYE